jgi:hypothetical protein
MKEEIWRLLAATGLTGLLGKSVFDYIRNKNTLVKIKACEQHREGIHTKLNSVALDLTAIKTRDEEKHDTIAVNLQEHKEDLKEIKREIKEISKTLAILIAKKE